ncbi:MAG: transglycosylase SLT domain-containing protein [Acidobacteria bacterium]|nr:transglycosylase SLT domain-containing protein [Acidobacteriota bacterium]
MGLSAAALSLACALSGAELAVLSTGYTIRAERHEQSGDRVWLHTESGVLELPAASIREFEALPEEPTEKKPGPVQETPAPLDVDALVEELSAKFGVHPALVRSVMQAESAGDARAVSHAGAIGLMQLMPETAKELEVDPWKPDENVLGGLRYLRQMLERYEGSPDQVLRALAAYNAGPGAVDRYDGLPPYSETRAYVRRVLDRFLKLSE